MITLKGTSSLAHSVISLREKVTIIPIFISSRLYVISLNIEIFTIKT